MLDALISQLRQTGSIIFFVRARPGAASTAVKEILDDGYVKIDVAAVPEGGKANVELIKFLADAFGVSKANVEIMSGQTAREKLIRVTC